MIPFMPCDNSMSLSSLSPLFTVWSASLKPRMIAVALLVSSRLLSPNGVSMKLKIASGALSGLSTMLYTSSAISPAVLVGGSSYMNSAPP